MKNLLERFFSNSLVHAAIALLAGVAAMIALFLFYEQVWTDTPGESEAVSDLATDSGGLIAGEVIPIHINSVPVPFVGGDDGAPLGYFFVDITLEVIGEPALQRANAALDSMVHDFTAGLSERGAGMTSYPGIVDYDRLAAEFLALAQVQVGNQEVARVVIQAAP